MKSDRGKSGEPAKVFDKAEDPLWAIQHDMEIDTQHYIKDISRPLARTLMWYIAPNELLAGVKTLERKIAAAECGGHHTLALDLEKALKKHLENMTEIVAKKLFGPGALADIPRPQQKRVGPIAKFLVPAHKRARNTPADAEHLAGLRSQLLEAKAKCTKCRGREDDTIACVQRDCPNLFKVALLTKDIEDLTK